jgi:hypothetical protein
MHAKQALTAQTILIILVQSTPIDNYIFYFFIYKLNFKFKFCVWMAKIGE